MRSLKNLVSELEELVHQHSSQLNTEVLAKFKSKLEQLKRELEEADAENEWRVAKEAVELLANLLSVVTNVSTLLG